MHKSYERGDWKNVCIASIVGKLSDDDRYIMENMLNLMEHRGPDRIRSGKDAKMFAGA